MCVVCFHDVIPECKGACSLQMLVQQKSKHCRRCDKCVAGFDHHCIFLNNCVGSRNYPTFLALLCSTILSAALHTGVATYLLVRSFTAASDTGAALSRIHGCRLNMTAFRVIAGASAGLAAIIVGLVIELLAFHMYLSRRGLNTYDYIMMKKVAQGARKIEAASGLDTLASLKCNTSSDGAPSQDIKEPSAAQTTGCCSIQGSRRLCRGMTSLICGAARIEPYPVSTEYSWTPACGEQRAEMLVATRDLQIRVLVAISLAADTDEVVGGKFAV